MAEPFAVIEAHGKHAQRALFTADGFYRRGTVVPLKPTADEALAHAPVVEHHHLVDHRQLQMRVGIVHGDAAILRQKQHEQPGAQQHARRQGARPGRRGQPRRRGR